MVERGEMQQEQHSGAVELSLSQQPVRGVSPGPRALGPGHVASLCPCNGARDKVNLTDSCDGDGSFWAQVGSCGPSVSNGGIHYQPSQGHFLGHASKSGVGGSFIPLKVSD